MKTRITTLALALATLAFGTRTDCDLLREELSVPGVDTIYRRCLA